jgi:hypothetical protein
MESEFTPNSIFQAAYVYCKGGRLLTVEGTPGRAKFRFDNKDGFAQRIALEYVQDTAAPAKSLFSALGALKHEADQALGPIRYARDGAMQ